MDSSSKMMDFIKRFIKNKVVLAIVGIVLGVVLVIAKSEAVKVAVIAVGIFLLVCAAVYFVLYVMRENKSGFLIFTGIVSAILGLIFVVKPEIIVNFFPVVMGLGLILSGIVDLSVSLGVMRNRGFNWIFAVAISLIIIILGILSVFRPDFIADVIVIYIGISIIVNGILDLVLIYKVNKGLNNPNTSNIDIEVEE